jgi:hypothetical protein
MQVELNRIKAKRKAEIYASHDLSLLHEAVLGLEWDRICAKAVTKGLSMAGLGLGSRMKENTKQMGKKLKNTVGRGCGKKGGREEDSAAGGFQTGW